VIQDKCAALLNTLNELNTSQVSDRNVVATAKSLIQIIISFKFILVMNFIRKVFDITTEVSNHLQSKSMDFIQAMTLVDVVKTRLQDLRCEENCIEIINDTKSFTLKNNMNKTNFKQIRTRKKKLCLVKLPGGTENTKICSYTGNYLPTQNYSLVFAVTPYSSLFLPIVTYKMPKIINCSAHLGSL